MQNAWKVGLFVLVFGALIVAAYSAIGRDLFAAEPMRIRAEFADAGGVNPGGRVLMAGIPIGTVESVGLASPTKAVLVLAIREGVRLPAGSTAVLPTSFIGIGDNPISIVPSTDLATGQLKEGDVIVGRRLGALDGIAPNLVPSLNATLQELNKTLVAARELVGDKGIRTELVAVLEQTTQTLDQFGSLASTATGALNENRKTIQATLKTFASAMADVERTAKLAADLLADPKYAGQAAEILESLNQTAKKADVLMSNVVSIVEDPDLKSGIKRSVTDMNAMTDSGTRIAANAEKVTSNGVTASENIVELTKKVNNLAEDAKSVLEKIKNFFEKPSTGSVFSKVSTSADLTRESEPGRYRVDFNARYPITDGSVHAGLYDAFEGNKLTVQLGKPLGRHGEYRYGMYAGKPGIGVDFPLTSKVKLRGNAYGLNGTRLDVRTEFDIRNEFLGYIGIDRIGDRNSLSVGIGIRK